MPCPRLEPHETGKRLATKWIATLHSRRARAYGGRCLGNMSAPRQGVEIGAIEACPAARTLAPISLNRPVKAIEDAYRLFKPWNHRGLCPERRCIRFARLKRIGIFRPRLGARARRRHVLRHARAQPESRHRRSCLGSAFLHVESRHRTAAQPGGNSDWRLPRREAACQVHQASSQLWSLSRATRFAPGSARPGPGGRPGGMCRDRARPRRESRYGSPALATTRLHLHRAESLLETARVSLQQKLATSAS